MNEFFYWLGIIYSALFGLVGFCLVMGLLAEHCWEKMRNVYGFVDIMRVYRAHRKGD